MVNKVSYLIKLKDQFSGVANKVSRSMGTVASKARQTSTEIRKLTRDTEKLKNTSRSLARSGAVMSAAVTTPFVLMSKSMINAASDAEETANKFGEVFKGIDSQSSAATQRLAQGFDLADSTVQELLANTGDLLTGLGMTSEQALQLSESVVALSSDVASFKNVEGGAARAANALTKALLGEQEMLKDTFKTAVLEAEVKEKMIGIKRKDRRLTDQQAKAIATLQIVTERNTAAIGDYARTSEAYANVSRKSQEATKRLSETFGKLMLPLAVKVTNALIEIVNAISNLSPGVKKAVLMFGGLIAVVGPLLLLLSAFVFVAATITGTMVLVAAGVTAAIAAIGALIVYWDDIVESLVSTFETACITVKNSFNSFIGFMMAGLNKVITPIANVSNILVLAFKNAWSTIKTGFVSFINFVIAGLNKIIAPLNDVSSMLGFGDINISPISTSTPLQNQSIDLNGEISVSATGNAEVKSTAMTAKTSGLNAGINMRESSNG